MKSWPGSKPSGNNSVGTWQLWEDEQRRRNNVAPLLLPCQCVKWTDRANHLTPVHQNSCCPPSLSVFDLPYGLLTARKHTKKRMTFENKQAGSTRIWSHYLSRSVSLLVPWGTRICSLPRAAPDTGRRDGTCWARMDHARRHRLGLEAQTFTPIFRTFSAPFFFDSIKRNVGNILGKFLYDRGCFQIDLEVLTSRLSSREPPCRVATFLGRCRRWMMVLPSATAHQNLPTITLAVGACGERRALMNPILAEHTGLPRFFLTCAFGRPTLIHHPCSLFTCRPPLPSI